MSIDGYFESVINIWKHAPKHTPAMKRDMKVVMEQFNTSIKHDEIPEDKVNKLKSEFKDIYHEVYD